jgi:hypothetical protein
MLLTTAGSITGDMLKALAWFGYTGFEIASRLRVPVWPSPRRGWQGEKAVDRKLEKAVRRFEGTKGLGVPRSYFGLSYRRGHGGRGADVVSETEDQPQIVLPVGDGVGQLRAHVVSLDQAQSEVLLEQQIQAPSSL